MRYAKYFSKSIIYILLYLAIAALYYLIFINLFHNYLYASYAAIFGAIVTMAIIWKRSTATVLRETKRKAVLSEGKLVETLNKRDEDQRSSTSS